jgi:hypothetical protein
MRAMTLRKVISGGQTGADQAGLAVAKRFRLETGGTMPKGFKTLNGNRPEMAVVYGLTEHESDNYVPRTYKNVLDSDGTVRLAGNFESSGEICTLKAIQKYGKPYFDVDLTDLPPVEGFVNWLLENNIEVLNVAGNAEQTYAGAFNKSYQFLTDAFFALGLEMVITDDDILASLGLFGRKIIYTNDRRIVESLIIKQIGHRQVKRSKNRPSHAKDGNGQDACQLPQL